jgi:hypothetical protein
MEELRKIMKYLNQDNPCPRRDSNGTPPECESRAFLLLPAVRFYELLTPVPVAASIHISSHPVQQYFEIYSRLLIHV